MVRRGKEKERYEITTTGTTTSRRVAVNEVAEKLKTALTDRLEVSALVNRVTLQFRNVDPLTSKEELMEDIKRELRISPADQVEVKALRMVPCGTQMAVVVMPANVVPKEEVALRLRTDLTIASARLLPNVQRC